MNPSLVPDASQIRGWAVRQLADYDARQPGMIFGEGVVLEVAAAYELQSAVVRLRSERGDQVIGYKVGCTSPKIRQQLGITHSVSGRLFDSEQHPSGAVLSRSRFANLAIEGELAVELSREPRPDDFAGDNFPACVARVFPVIELHNHVVRGEQLSAGELIANNAIHAGFVAGEGIGIDGTPDDHAAAFGLQILSDNETVDECDGTTLIPTIHSSLQWLNEVVRGRGEQLCRGQIILTGSIPTLIPVAEDCIVRVEAPPFGCVEATFGA